jgi:hypothetical protein
LLAALHRRPRARRSVPISCGRSSHLKPVPGRFQPVDAGQPFTVIVDYAHTDDALRNLTALARKMTAASGARVITLFGCGGDRDRTKRPKMGQAAGEGSDFVVATSDNPRSEDPLAILAEIEPGSQVHRHPIHRSSPTAPRPFVSRFRLPIPATSFCLPARAMRRNRSSPAARFHSTTPKLRFRHLQRIGLQQIQRDLASNKVRIIANRARQLTPVTNVTRNTSIGIARFLKSIYRGGQRIGPSQLAPANRQL